MAERTRWDTAVVWFRRDLRIADHPALSDAVTNARRVVPLFVIDRNLVSVSPARAWLLAGALAELHEALSSRGAGLLVREGPAHEVVPSVAAEVGAEVVLATRDVTPRSHRRDSTVATALDRDGRKLQLRPGLLLAEPEAVLTKAGEPYGVFSPFWRALQQTPRRMPLPAPDALVGSAKVEPSGVPAWLAARSRPQDDLPAPGESAAHDRLLTWVSGRLARYDTERNRLDGDGSSHLGADLHLGLLSPLQVERAATESGEDASAFVRQLAWREFYHHRLFHRRAESNRVSASPLTSAFRSEADDPDAVAAWREGRTGIPAVDAAMRQLAASGWMSNRARLIVASFLTRHLLMDYRIGERHFLRHLVDGDVANNLGGWEWTAGVGADPQPWFRIFNPVLQGRRFDPDGAWVRRWVPELGPVPDRYVHAPWEMPEDVALEVDVVLGETYPRPVIDLAAGRERALAAFKAATGRKDD